MSRAQGYAGATTLKTPYRDGTTHIILEPLDFIARLAALVPRPCVNLTPFHGVFAPDSGLRHHVTPAQRRAARTWAWTYMLDQQRGGQVGLPRAISAFAVCWNIDSITEALD